MAGQSVLAEASIHGQCTDHAPGMAHDIFEVRPGEFYSDDFGLVIDSPPLTIAAALAATTVAVTALVVFVVSEIAGRYAARSRGGAR